MEPLDTIRTIYERDKPHILPFVGDAYTTPAADGLRVMAVGINAYVPDDVTNPAPGAHREWFVDGRGRHRYQQAVRKLVDVMGRALTAEHAMFAGKRYADPRSLYATNAVKVYVPISHGKRAAQLDDADWTRHVGQWHDELAVLAEARVFPHVVVILSEKFWETAWQTFHPSHHGPQFGVTEAKDFVSLEDDTRHRANRIAIRFGGERQDVMLLRLRHPAGRGTTGTAAWLLKRDAFRRFAQLGSAA